MRISHTHKFVFIANQKTASSAIRSSLDEYSDINGISDLDSPYYYHTTASKLKKHFDEQNWNWNEYFKFSFVRNPWDLAVSHFFYRNKMLKNTITNSENNWLGGFFQDAYVSVGFIEWLHKIQGKLTFINGKVSTQVDMMYDESGNCLLDFVGKFENIESDFKFVCDSVGLHDCELGFKNKTHHTHYSEYYDNETEKLIYDLYKADVDEFGYTFNED